MNEVDEFYWGEEVILTFTSKDKTKAGDPLTGVSAGTFVILPGYDSASAIELDVLTDFTSVEAGVYQYTYDTSGLDMSNGPIEHSAQARTTGDLVGSSPPYYFRVLPLVVPDLT